jgi:hypothetical protein
MYVAARDEVGPPATPEDMAFEITWIILCAGRSAQAARTIEKKVRAAINAGTPVVDACGYRAKAAVIERAWHERVVDFAALQKVLAAQSPEHLVAWCKCVPFVGDDTHERKRYDRKACQAPPFMAGKDSAGSLRRVLVWLSLGGGGFCCVRLCASD